MNSDKISEEADMMTKDIVKEQTNVEMNSDKMSKEEADIMTKDIPKAQENVEFHPSWLTEGDTDDEETIAEEEALGREYTSDEELYILSKDQTLPLEELIAQIKGERDESVESSEDSLNFSWSSPEPSGEDNETQKSIEPQEIQDSELARFYLTKVVPKAEVTKSDEEDEEYVPLGAVRREVRVGQTYQADLDVMSPSPGTLSDYDTLVWKPTSDLSDSSIEEYLKTANKIVSTSDPKNGKAQTSTCVPDNDLALEILMKCKHDVKKSLNELKEQVTEQVVTEQLPLQMRTDVTSKRSLTTNKCLDDEVPRRKKVKRE